MNGSIGNLTCNPQFYTENCRVIVVPEPPVDSIFISPSSISVAVRKNSSEGLRILRSGRLSLRKNGREGLQILSSAETPLGEWTN
jgi:hypothetical protein